MYHQGSRADLSQIVAGRLGRVPIVLRSVVTRALADKLLRPYGEALARLRAPQRALATLERVNAELERRVEARTAELRRSEERYRELFDNAGDLVYTHDLAGHLTDINRATERLTGYAREEALRLNVRDLVAPEDRAVLQRLLRARDPLPPTELGIVTRDGRRVPLEVSLRRIVEAGKPIGVQGIARDISERKRLEARLQHQASHDPLTGLANRALFLDRLQRAIRQSQPRRGERFAVLYFDLDRFKTVNDTLGHPTGDRLLTALAQRVQACLDPRTTVARLGGDEFAVLLDNVAGETAATEVATRIAQDLARPFQLGGREVHLTTSIGIVLGPGGYAEPEELLRDADIALYQAKAQGKARQVVFHPRMHATVLALSALEHDLKRALEREEFRLHYQPLVALGSGQLRGFEALVRWQHPERGLLPPSEFIPLAEETGLIVPLGWWVLEAACRQLRAWQEASPACEGLGVSVNLSAKQFAQPDLSERVGRVLQATGLAGHHLQLEITESAVMEHAGAATAVLAQLRALDVQLAVDDFGTGYSSLSYLKRFPLDTLKIDKAFVRGLGKDPDDTAIVQAIVSLAHTLGLQVTAEGVETTKQVRRLQALGCTLAQGYLFARPLAPAVAWALVCQGPPAYPLPRGHRGQAQIPSTGELRQRRTERARRLVLPTVRQL